ncbi:hypothetical protein FNI15_12630 [Salmonella enterica subsp. salamae]|nr:hypothetical protein [Salmonella enterica]ECC1744255.1 hypothetical protein [Salmonella enterica subsp. salamae]ECF6028452.1 hypothetical protein [Salmonella enterica subsp. salamae serovar Greenside]EDT2642670.1 hypothetical protein [Salmonella enterica subsp. enterica serovar Abony]EDV4561749.1 hypothetical protein [Salmonella enterica subsp. enterica]
MKESDRRHRRQLFETRDGSPGLQRAGNNTINRKGEKIERDVAADANIAGWQRERLVRPTANARYRPDKRKRHPARRAFNQYTSSPPLRSGA